MDYEWFFKFLQARKEYWEAESRKPDSEMIIEGRDYCLAQVNATDLAERIIREIQNKKSIEDVESDSETENV